MQLADKGHVRREHCRTPEFLASPALQVTFMLVCSIVIAAAKSLQALFGWQSWAGLHVLYNDWMRAYNCSRLNLEQVDPFQLGLKCFVAHLNPFANAAGRQWQGQHQSSRSRILVSISFCAVVARASVLHTQILGSSQACFQPLFKVSILQVQIRKLVPLHFLQSGMVAGMHQK